MSSEGMVRIHGGCGCWSFLSSLRCKRRSIKAPQRIGFEVPESGVVERRSIKAPQRIGFEVPESGVVERSSIKAPQRIGFEVPESGVVRDCISDLPDELLGHILGHLTLRDSVRTRLLSRRWRHLFDCRSVVQFDPVNILGFPGATRTDLSKQPSKLVRAVDCFIQEWTGLGLNVDKVKIHLGNAVHTSQIDGWVQSFVRMRVRELELTNQFNVIHPTYVLSSSLLYYSGDESYTECLRLDNCGLALSVGHSMSWISGLTTLDMNHVHIEREDMECILSSALNLTSLRLVSCYTHYSPQPSISIQLPKLKRLVLTEHVVEVVLNCPNLVALVARLYRRLKFSDVIMPLLSVVDLGWIQYSEYYSQNFDALTRHAPNLHALSLIARPDKVHQPIFTNEMIMNCRLKWLNVHLHIYYTGLDMFTLTHMINVCPFLEELHLQLTGALHVEESPQSECTDCPHFHLKHVKIFGRTKKGMEKEFAQYLLKNAVLLGRVMINGVPLLKDKKSQDLLTIL